MEDQSEIESLIRAAKAGDERAEAEFFSKLAVRFFSLVTRELRMYPILTKRINLEEKSREVCQQAVAEVMMLYPLRSPKWSLARAASVLHNVLDDFVTNTLTDLAKNNDRDAEHLLFTILRKKLMNWIDRKKGRVSQYEY